MCQWVEYPWWRNLSSSNKISNWIVTFDYFTSSSRHEIVMISNQWWLIIAAFASATNVKHFSSLHFSFTTKKRNRSRKQLNDCNFSRCDSWISMTKLHLLAVRSTENNHTLGLICQQQRPKYLLFLLVHDALVCEWRLNQYLNDHQVEKLKNVKYLINTFPIFTIVSVSY